MNGNVRVEVRNNDKNTACISKEIVSEVDRLVRRYRTPECHMRNRAIEMFVNYNKVKHKKHYSWSFFCTKKKWRPIFERRRKDG